jgi:ComF family protein
MKSILPSHCLLCRRLNPSLICLNCQDTLPWHHNPCRQCATELLSATQTHCGQCLKQPPPWDFLISPWSFNDPIPNLVHRFKFSFMPHLASFLAELATPYIRAYQELDPVDLIVPIPLHRFRLAIRWYNQAEWIAETFAKALNCPLNTRILHRSRYTRPQARLEQPNERQRNVQKAFCVKSAPLARHIALVDDVLTTGSTAKACIEAWNRVSPARFSVWCLARGRATR